MEITLPYYQDGVQNIGSGTSSLGIGFEVDMPTSLRNIFGLDSSTTYRFVNTVAGQGQPSTALHRLTIPINITSNGTADAVFDIAGEFFKYGTGGDINFKGLVDFIYPIGAIYITTTSVNPGILWVGTTWVSFGAGRTLVGLNSNDGDFDQVEETGGAKTHTLSTNEMPQHNHTYGDYWITTHPYYMWSSAAPQNMWGMNNKYNEARATGYRGESYAHNNLQPYIVTYMWKRTA